jgi:hypothetical protein
MRGWPRFRRASAYLRVSLAIAALLVYATTALALHQYRNMNFYAERGALAAAISTTVYGAPLGASYSGVNAYIHNPNTALLQSVRLTASGKTEAGSLIFDGGADGSGIGYLLVATLGMLVFGPHLVSPTLMMLMVMTISAAAYLWRFGTDCAVVTMLYFSSLTLLIFTAPVYTRSVAQELPIAGIRYFAVVGVLPSLHIATELLCRAPATERWRFGFLVIQVIILVLAILTRSSNAAFLGVIGVIWVVSAWRNRRDPIVRSRLIGSGVCIAGTAAGLFMLILSLFPSNYLGDGRFTGVIWHRAFVGLGYNPEWPFGDLREKYKCDTVKGGPASILRPGPLDANGLCIWQHYRQEHPEVPNTALVYGAQYERVLREAFFEVVREYPRQVWQTEIYYKSKMAHTEIRDAIHPQFRLSEYSNSLQYLFVTICALLAIFIIVPWPVTDIRQSLRFIGLTLGFSLSNFPGYFLAWPGTSQTFDLKLLVMMAVGLVLNAAVEWVKGRCWSTASATTV